MNQTAFTMQGLIACSINACSMGTYTARNKALHGKSGLVHETRYPVVQLDKAGLLCTGSMRSKYMVVPVSYHSQECFPSLR